MDAQLIIFQREKAMNQEQIIIKTVKFRVTCKTNLLKNGKLLTKGVDLHPK